MFPMKTLLSISFILLTFLGFCQEGPQEVTAEMITKIKADIEAEIPSFKQRLLDEEKSEKEIEYSIDTFRIEQLSVRRMDIDYSTIGMKEAMNELNNNYDILLNKYYNVLMKSLKSEDKQVLKTAQKAWLAYRDAENLLIWKMLEDQYSGGGTIQGLFGLSNYYTLIKTRTEDLFHYYDSIVSFE